MQNGLPQANFFENWYFPMPEEPPPLKKSRRGLGPHKNFLVIMPKNVIFVFLGFFGKLPKFNLSSQKIVDLNKKSKMTIL